MKVLILDIETAPNIAYVWRFFKENVGAKQVIENSTLLSYAAKWLGQDQIYYDDCREDLNESRLVLGLSALLDQADVVVAHNGIKFDIPKINTACLRQGQPPPSPFKVVDTCAVARKEFGFESNSLEHIADHLRLKYVKLPHKKFPGFELWLECLRGTEEAWEEMREYNINDILLLENLYLQLRPWIKNHPNAGVYVEDDRTICPKCGSQHIHFRGYAYTSVGKYRKFVCNDCGGWGRLRLSEYDKDKRKVLAVNVAS